MQAKVLHLIAGSAQGGAEAFCLRLLPSLARRGLSQALITRPHMTKLEELAAAGIAVDTARFATPWMDWQTKHTIRKAVVNFQPNIIMTWMNRASAFSRRLVGREVKIVGRLGGYYDLKYYGHCDALIGNTADLVTYFEREGWPADRAFYLPNFADTSALATSLPRPAGPLLLALGRLHPNKGFDVLFNALAQIPQARLWLAGDGDLKSALQDQAAQLGILDRIDFLGWRTDITALYAAADIFLCPSRHEPLGNVILEAMAAGKAIVSTANQGALQLLQDGHNAVITPIDDAAAMARAVNDLVAHPQRAVAFGYAAKQTYLANYSEDAVCARYLEFFNN
ncbi:MAG: glycosyltransferase, partial [Verrucomicrobia bacterium]|nr:glycosyltransferase [Verrucomicrobiota bacterium]